MILDWLSIGQVLVKYSILNWVSILGKYPPLKRGYTLPDILSPDRGLEYLATVCAVECGNSVCGGWGRTPLFQ